MDAIVVFLSAFCYVSTSYISDKYIVKVSIIEHQDHFSLTLEKSDTIIEIFDCTTNLVHKVSSPFTKQKIIHADTLYRGGIVTDIGMLLGGEELLRTTVNRTSKRKSVEKFFRRNIYLDGPQETLYSVKIQYVKSDTLSKLINTPAKKKFVGWIDASDSDGFYSIYSVRLQKEKAPYYNYHYTISQGRIDTASLNYYLNLPSTYYDNPYEYHD